MSNLIVNSTVGPRAVLFMKEMAGVTEVDDPLQKQTSKRKKVPPYYAEPCFSSNGTAAYGTQQVAYQVNSPTGLFNSGYDTLQHTLTLHAGLNPAARYVDGFGLRMVNQLIFRIGNEDIVRLDPYSIFMWLQTQPKHRRDMYYRGIGYGTTHNLAETQVDQELCMTIPNAFDEFVNTLRTRRLAQGLNYLVNYANLSDILFNAGNPVPANTITGNRVEFYSIATPEPFRSVIVDQPQQNISVTTFDYQNARIAAGTTNFVQQLTVPKRIKRILFYVSVEGDMNVAPVASFVGIQIRDFRFNVAGAPYPPTGLQSHMRNQLYLAENLDTILDTNVYGWTFPYQRLGDENLISSGVCDMSDLSRFDLEINFTAALVGTHLLHVYYEIDQFIKVDQRGNVTLV